MTENGDKRIIRGEKYDKDKFVDSKALLTASYEFTVRSIVAKEGLGYFKVTDGKSSFIHSESYQNRGRNGGIKMADLTIPYFRSLFDRSKEQLPNGSKGGVDDEEVASAFLIMLIRNGYFDLVYRYLSLTRNYVMRLDYRVFAEFVRLAPEKADRITYIFARLASPPRDDLFEEKSLSLPRDRSAKTICRHIDHIVAFVDILVRAGRFDLIGDALAFKNDLFLRFSVLVKNGKAVGKIRNIKNVLFNNVIIPAFHAKREMELFSSYSFNSLVGQRQLTSFKEIMTYASSRRTTDEITRIVATIIGHGDGSKMDYVIPVKIFEKALHLIPSERFDRVCQSIQNVRGKHAKAAEILSRNGHDFFIVSHWEDFEDIDMTPYLLKLLKGNDSDQEYVASKITSISSKQIKFARVFLALLYCNNRNAALTAIQTLSKKESSHKLVLPVRAGIIIKQRYDVRTLLLIIHHFPRNLIDEIVNTLTETGEWKVLVENLAQFHRIERVTAHKLCLAGYSLSVLKYLSHFVGLTSTDYIDVITLSQTERFWASALLHSIQSIPDETLPVQIFVKIVEEADSYSEEMLAENLIKFYNLRESPRAQTAAEKLLSALIEDHAIDCAMEVIEHFKFKSTAIDISMQKFFNNSTEEFELDIYNMVWALINNDGEWLPNLRNVGIYGTGKHGANELHELYRNVQKRLIAGTLSDDDLSSPVIFVLLRHIVHYRRSGEGNTTNEAFEDEIKAFKATRQGLKYRGERSHIAKTYAPSETLYIKRSADEPTERKHSRDFNIRWGILRESIANGLAAWDQTTRDHSTESMQSMIETVRFRASGMRKSILSNEARYRNADPEVKEKATVNIRIRLEALDTIENITHEADVHAIQRAVNALSYFGDEFTREIISLSVYFACAMHPSLAMSAPDLALSNPSLEHVSWVIDLLEHHIGSQSVGQLFTEREARSNYRRIIRTGALQEGLIQMADTGHRTTAIKFIPDQGLLMQFSGQLAHACWASQEIIEHPNVFCIAMVQNPGTKHESIVGASLMIEATARDGTQLLIIRGLNPRESTINALDAENFCDQFFDYARKLAHASRRTLAITIDGHQGGAGTNRPILFQHLYGNVRPSLSPVYLGSQVETEINGYDIRGETYFLS